MSTANLADLVSTSYLATQVGSTVIGLGTVGYLSSIPSLGGFVSTANLADLVSTSYLASQLGSTVIGLGTAGYVSTATLGFTLSSFSTAQSQNFYSSNISVSSLTTSSLTFGTGSGYLFLPNTVMNSLSVGIIYASTIVGFIPGGGSIGGGIVSTANLADLVSTSYLASQLGSTVIGLGTAGYLSSIPSLGGFVSTANLVNLISTANLADLVSTSYLATQLGSTVIGLGTAGYVSSSQLLSTSIGLTQYISSFIDPTELTSTVIGLGTAGFVSSIGFATNVTSTVIGLGTAGYISTATLGANLSSFSTAQSQNFYSSNISVSSLTTSSLTFGTGSGYLFLPNTVMNSLSVGIIYASTIVGFTPGGLSGGGLVSTANLADLVSTANLANLISTANLANLISTANLVTLVSTSYFTSQITSSIIGLGTTGYISTLSNVGFISSVQAQASSFSGNLGDALTLIMADM